MNTSKDRLSPTVACHLNYLLYLSLFFSIPPAVCFLFYKKLLSFFPFLKKWSFMSYQSSFIGLASLFWLFLSLDSFLVLFTLFENSWMCYSHSHNSWETLCQGGRCNSDSGVSQYFPVSLPFVHINKALSWFCRSQKIKKENLVKSVLQKYMKVRIFLKKIFFF